MMLANKVVISAGYRRCTWASRGQPTATSLALRHHYHIASRLPAARHLPPSDKISEEEDPSSTRSLLDAIDSTSMIEGRIDEEKITSMLGAGSTNVSWTELDEKVNIYPSDRRFQAIGEGGDAFVAEIVELVEVALGRKASPTNVKSRPSSKGKYVSASITVRMENGEEVLAIYAALKGCDKVKWYL